MPWAIAKPCAQPGCVHKQPCPMHPKPKRWGHDKRPSAQARGYGGDWAALRKRVLKEQRFTCERCGERAVVVHHRHEITGPDDPKRLERTNCEALCRDCHERHHGRR